MPQHRANQRVLVLGSASGSNGGKRKARHKRHTALAIAPSAVAVTALLGAGLATATLGQGHANADPLAVAIDGYAVSQPALGTDFPITPREAGVSRATARDAAADAAGAPLKDAAEVAARQRSAALAKLAAKAENRAAEVAKNQWQLPLAPGTYRLSARFGQCSSLWSRCHTGLDMAAPSGSPIFSVANGVVVSTEYAGSYGNRTIVALEDGTEIWYCHQTAFAASTGDRVASGEVIGYVGSTGNSTGPHLHIEVRPGAGDPVDPFAAMLQHGVTP